MIIKNSNLRRVIFENRYKILAIIVAIILVLCLIRALNELAKQQAKKKNTSTQINTQSSYKPQETLVLGEDVSNAKQQESTKIMDEFISYCNKKEIEKAYNLLTDSCKEEIFNSSIENFKTNYVEKIFTSFKTYNMQAWINAINTTYKVRILNDVLSTGTTGEVIEDYVTIVKQNNQYKISVNSYITKTDINKKTEKNGVVITVTSKNTYMDYEIYNIKVENNTKNTILLDTKTKQKSAYITSSKNVTYSAFMHEVDNAYLSIKPQLYTNTSIKFNKIYSPNISINKLTFTDVVTNLEEYNQLQNKSEYQKTIIEVEL